MPNPLYSPASWGFAVLCLSLAYRIVCPPAELRALLANVQTASYNLSAAAYQAHLALATINDPHAGIPAVLSALNGKHGVRQVLKNVDILTLQIGRTTNSTRLAAVDEHAWLTGGADSAGIVRPGVMPTAQALVADASTHLNGSMDALTSDLNRIGVLTDGLTADSHATFASSTKAINQLGAFVAAPEWAAMRANLVDTSKHLDGTVTHFDAIAAAGDQAVYNFMHPPKLAWWKMVGRDVVFPILERAAGPVFGDIASHWFRPRVDVTLTGGK